MNDQDKQKIINSFDKIALFPDAWNQNRFYHNLLLRFIPKSCKNALDIGCGTGEFTFQLSKVAQRVIGIDISEKMIQEAKKRNLAGNIDYRAIDFDEFETKDQFDLIVSIATLHHLNLEKALVKINSLLRENGILVILDLYDRSNSPWAILDIFALPLNSILSKIKRWSNRVSKEETGAWAEHKLIDRYPAFTEIKRIYSDHLGNVKIKRLLFWRYLLSYKKTPERKSV